MKEAFSFRYALNHDDARTLPTRRHTGPGITFQAVLSFVPRMLGVLYVEMLVHGNATAAEVWNSNVKLTRERRHRRIDSICLDCPNLSVCSHRLHICSYFTDCIV